MKRTRVRVKRDQAWLRLFPPGAPSPLDALSPHDRQLAREAADMILAAHEDYAVRFRELTVQAQSIFERRDWARGRYNAEQRVRIYREAVNATATQIQDCFGRRILDSAFWMGMRRAFHEAVFDRYDADLAQTLFYSTMRLAFDEVDIPVEYSDDGLAERWHILGAGNLWAAYPGHPDCLAASVCRAIRGYGFAAQFEDLDRDAARAAQRLQDAWRQLAGDRPPRLLKMLTPAFFRDREAYLVGTLRASGYELPVVLALLHGDAGITIDAVLAGKEDMRNILFVSTRSTFAVSTDQYRELLRILDSLAPERGHPAMCAVIGFTHPARVALNHSLREHLRTTGERFEPTPGRAGTAMIVFAPPGFPYVFKVVRDHSDKLGWKGRQQIMESYRRVHEINRGRLMLDAWLYRNLPFPRECFEPGMLRRLLEGAPSSVRLDGGTVVLGHVYAQRRVRPLNLFFEQERNPELRERAIDALGTLLKDLAGMGFFFGDHYGLPSNTGLTHGFNVTLFDFDDLGPLLRFRFRQTPPPPPGYDDFTWNVELNGPWFRVEPDDVLVDEWERFLGIPPDLQACFLRRHGDLFTLDYWSEARRRITRGMLHFVLPYPPDRRLG